MITVLDFINFVRYFINIFQVDVKLAVARTQEAIENSEMNSMNARKRKNMTHFQRQQKNVELSANKVYVGGVKNGIEENDLKEYFGKFGNVSCIYSGTPTIECKYICIIYSIIKSRMILIQIFIHTYPNLAFRGRHY